VTIILLSLRIGITDGLRQIIEWALGFHKGTINAMEAVPRYYKSKRPFWMTILQTFLEELCFGKDTQRFSKHHAATKMTGIRIL